MAVVCAGYEEFSVVKDAAIDTGTRLCKKGIRIRIF